MSLYILGLAALQLLATQVGASPTVRNNTPIVVSLRIEGATTTIFEGSVTTYGHNVTTKASGNHICDGTNHGTHEFPGPTATSALDDAAAQGGFTWDGTFFDDLDDFLISRVANTSQMTGQYWILGMNFAFAQFGGCQQFVTPEDAVIWGFGSSQYLKLDGPTTAQQGKPITVTVTDGANGEPIANARVAGQFTGNDGTVNLTFTEGTELLKAEHDQWIRSNLLEVTVSPALVSTPSEVEATQARFSRAMIRNAFMVYI